jgi:predicted ATPase
MFLKRIQATNYRPILASNFVFKKIDLSFDRYFNPCIFPLGGRQGCGKSTLLAAIYNSLTNEPIQNLDLEIQDRDKGNCYFIRQNPNDGILWVNGALTLDYIKNKDSTLSIGSDAQQKKEALLKHLSKIQDSIILLDNPDLGLHPDEQYNLCSDIVDLDGNNQYIVATHSYGFCEALTPSHVRVLKN